MKIIFEAFDGTQFEDEDEVRRFHMHNKAMDRLFY